MNNVPNKILELQIFLNKILYLFKWINSDYASLISWAENSKIIKVINTKNLPNNFTKIPLTINYQRLLGGII